MKKIDITKFALRHFDPAFAGTKVLGLTPAELVDLANQVVAEQALKEGYAPFCKHLFIGNTTPTRCGYARITVENAHLLRTGYEARRPSELPILCRWFEGVEAPQAAFLDLVLYSREQLLAEGEDDVPDAEWAIVSVNAEMFPTESPLAPITQMRNALGKDQGGSGVALDEAKYRAAVEFWGEHATVR